MSTAKKKWSAGDIIILGLQVISPVIAIVFTSLFPKGQNLSADTKLAIVGVGIVVPLIILQSSIIRGQNKSESDILDLKRGLDSVLDRISHISPILERVFLAGNERVERFVYRRMDEVTRAIQIALSSNNSGNLRPSEYYAELLYLAEMIIRDHAEQKNNFNGEIWAMTSFADEEWIEDEGYEKLWTEKLADMVDRGIKTRRLCIVPDSIVKLISNQTFSEQESKKTKAFQGFVSYLKTYYGNKSRKGTAEHYFIRTNDNPDLTHIKGFFAIKLTSGELHILHGETVNEDGALTAKVLFDPSEIRKVRELFDLHARPSQEFGAVIAKLSKQNLFPDYLRRQGVSLSDSENAQG